MCVQALDAAKSVAEACCALVFELDLLYKHGVLPHMEVLVSASVCCALPVSVSQQACGASTVLLMLCIVHTMKVCKLGLVSVPDTLLLACTKAIMPRPDPDTSAKAE